MLCDLSPHPLDSFWLQHFDEAHWQLPTVSASELDTATPHDADVLIVGAGITGCALAYHLRRLAPLAKVVVVEARSVGGGATGRNGGLFWPELNLPWSRAVELLGLDGAREALRFEVEAAEHVLRFVHDHGCAEAVGLVPFADGGITLFSSPEEAEAARSDLAQARAQAGPDLVARADWLRPACKAWSARQVAERLHVPPGAFHGALQQPGASRVCGAKLAAAFAAAAAAAAPKACDAGCDGDGRDHRNSGDGVGGGGDKSDVGYEGGVNSGVVFVEGAEVSSIQPASPNDGDSGSSSGDASSDGGGGGSSSSGGGGGKPHRADGDGRLIIVTLANGATFRTSAVAHCTNALADRLLPELAGRLTPVRNHVAALRPAHASAPGLPLDAGFSTDRGYVYFSQLPGGRDIVLGGFRNVAADMEWGVSDDGAVDPQVAAALRVYLPAKMPAAFEPAVSELPAPHRAMRSTRSAGDVLTSPALEMPPPPPEGDWAGGVGAAPAPGGAAAAAAAAADEGPPLEMEMEWTGIMGFSPDMLPLVGPLPQRPGQFLCAGFSGHGMTLTYSCAAALACMMLGRPLEWPGLPASYGLLGRL